MITLRTMALSTLLSGSTLFLGFKQVSTYVGSSREIPFPRNVILHSIKNGTGEFGCCFFSWKSSTFRKKEQFPVAYISALHFLLPSPQPSFKYLCLNRYMVKCIFSSSLHFVLFLCNAIGSSKVVERGEHTWLSCEKHCWKTIQVLFLIRVISHSIACTAGLEH